MSIDVESLFTFTYVPINNTIGYILDQIYVRYLIIHGEFDITTELLKFWVAGDPLGFKVTNMGFFFVFIMNNKT